MSPDEYGPLIMVGLFVLSIIVICIWQALDDLKSSRRQAIAVRDALLVIDPSLLDALGRDSWANGRVLDESRVLRVAEMKRRQNQRVEDTSELEVVESDLRTARAGGNK